MIEEDKIRFAEILTGVSEVYGQTITKAGLRVWWQAVGNYQLEDIEAALNAHVRDPDQGLFMPRPADVIRGIEGPAPTVDQVIAAAMEPKTALAVLCRIKIGRWNLDNWDRNKLAPLAEACIAMIPEWKGKIERGNLSAHEKSVCLRYGADVSAARLTPGKQVRKQMLAVQRHGNL